MKKLRLNLHRYIWNQVIYEIIFKDLIKDINQKQIVLLLHIAYWIGIIADAISTLVLLSPELAQSAFGLLNISFGEEFYMYQESLHL